MKNHRLLGAIVLALLTLPMFSFQLAAQQNLGRHHRYKMIEIGTFGGANSVYNVLSRIATNDGTVVGAANTNVPDPACFDPETCFVQHAWKWQNGVIEDLGVLPGGQSSYTNAINSRGLIVGQADDGEIDPLTNAPTFVATAWDQGRIRNLGTLGGGFSIAIAVNDQNFVMGAAENGLVDHSGPFSFDGVSQIRAFGWSGGDIFDLGTLGGEDAFPVDMNALSEIAGFSTTTLVPNSDGIIPVHPFLWSKGTMRDLGSLGGSFADAGAINNHGEVVGTSNLAGDQTWHPFIWRNGEMIDLGTLGGSNGVGQWINEAGDAIGYSNRVGDQGIYAFLWRDGAMTDLGTVAGDNSSNAVGINSRGQVVGESWFWNGEVVTAAHAFLWEDGGPIVDLNTISYGSTVHLEEANFITDRGEIVARGTTSDGHVHTVLLIPDGVGH